MSDNAGIALVVGAMSAALIAWEIDRYFPAWTIPFHVTQTGRRGHLVRTLLRGAYDGHPLSACGVTFEQMVHSFGAPDLPFDWGHTLFVAMALERGEPGAVAPLFDRARATASTSPLHVFLRAQSAATDALLARNLDRAKSSLESIPADQPGQPLAAWAIAEAEGRADDARGLLEKWKESLRRQPASMSVLLRAAAAPLLRRG